jgi:hypothetical protein
VSVLGGGEVVLGLAPVVGGGCCVAVLGAGSMLVVVGAA